MSDHDAVAPALRDASSAPIVPSSCSLSDGFTLAAAIAAIATGGGGASPSSNTVTTLDAVALRAPSLAPSEHARAREA